MILGILESGLPLVDVNKENNIIQCYYSVLHVGDELFFCKYTYACKNINIGTPHSVQLFSH